MSKEEPIISYIELKTFFDNKVVNRKEMSLSKYLKCIQLTSEKSSFYEVLSNRYIRPYFDIDMLPSFVNLNEFLNLLVLSFKNYFDCKYQKIIITLTKNISKDAYHIFLRVKSKPLIVDKKELKKFVQNFNEKYYYTTQDGRKKQQTILDSKVYNNNQLFRSVNQIKCETNKIQKNQNTKHVLIQGNIEDTIIQNFLISKSILLTQKVIIN